MATRWPEVGLGGSPGRYSARSTQNSEKLARVAQHPQGSGVTPEYGKFFPGPNPAVVPKPTDEANRCNLGRVTPKTLQKALYVGFSQIDRPLQVVWRDMKLQCLLLKYGQFIIHK